MIESVKYGSLEDYIPANGFSWCWKQEPSNSMELHELLQLYRDIGELNISGVLSTYGFRFNMTLYVVYKVSGMMRLIDSKLILFKGPKICWSK